jgi:chromosome segregation ATPase
MEHIFQNSFFTQNAPACSKEGTALEGEDQDPFVERSFSKDLFSLAEGRIEELEAVQERLISDNHFLLSKVKELIHEKETGTSSSSSNANGPLMQEISRLKAELEREKSAKFPTQIDALLAIDEEGLAPKERDLHIARLNAMVVKLNKRREEQDIQLANSLENSRKLELQLQQKDSQIAQSKEEYTTQYAKLKDAQSKISLLDSKIDHFRAKEAELEKKISALKVHNEKLTETSHEFKAAYEKLQANEMLLAQHVKQQDAEISRLSQANASMIEERTKLAENCRLLSEKVTRIEAEKEAIAKECSAELSHLHQECQRAKLSEREAKAQADSIHASLEGKRKEKEKLLDLFNKTLEDKEAISQQLHKALAEVSDLKLALSTQIAIASPTSCSEGFSPHDSAKETLQAENGKLKRELAKRDKQLTKVVDERAVIMQELDNLRLRLSTTESQNESLQENISELQINITTLQSQLQQSQNENELVKASLASAEASIAKQRHLYDSIQGMKQEILQLQKENERMNRSLKEHKALESKVGQLQAEYDKLLIAFQESKNEYDQLELVYQETKTRKLQMEMQIESERAKSKVSQEALERERQQRSTWEKTLSEAKTREFQLQSQVQELREENTSLKKNVESLNKTDDTFAGQQQDLEALGTNFASARKQISYSMNQIVRKEDIANAQERNRMMNELRANLLNARAVGADSPMTTASGPILKNSPAFSSATTDGNVFGEAM